MGKQQEELELGTEGTQSGREKMTKYERKPQRMDRVKDWEGQAEDEVTLTELDEQAKGRSVRWGGVGARETAGSNNIDMAVMNVNA